MLAVERRPEGQWAGIPSGCGEGWRAHQPGYLGHQTQGHLPSPKPGDEAPCRGWSWTEQAGSFSSHLQSRYSGRKEGDGGSVSVGVGRGRHSQDKDVNWNPGTEKGAQIPSCLCPHLHPQWLQLSTPAHGQMSGRGRAGEDEGAGEGEGRPGKGRGCGEETQGRRRSRPLHTRALEALQTLHLGSLWVCPTSPLISNNRETWCLVVSGGEGEFTS